MRCLVAAAVGLALSAPIARAADPDPLAVAILYEVWVSYSPEPSAPTRILQKKHVDAVVHCLIENRHQETLKPTLMWQYATKAAGIIRAKGVADIMWPIAARSRKLKGREAEFAFAVNGRMNSDYPVSGTFNAIQPWGMRSKGVPVEAIELEMGGMGLPDMAVCVKPPPAISAPGDDTDEGGL